MNKIFAQKILCIFGTIRSAFAAETSIFLPTEKCFVSDGDDIMDAAEAAAMNVTDDKFFESAAIAAQKVAWIEAYNFGMRTSQQNNDFTKNKNDAAVKAVWYYLLTHQEQICAAIDAVMPSCHIDHDDKIDYKKTIDMLLDIDCKKFKSKNEGVACWYLSEVWNLAKIISYKPTKLEELIISSGLAMVSFMEWVRGVDYSLEEFIFASKPSVLIPDLLVLVYKYNSRPALKNVTMVILEKLK